ncbi:LHFPL tetraspan subfamily member 2a protein [Cimex lectularius]|uniref:Lipoma HMGIC fusion partner-like 2 protein n=1 Tax=Cimex lectularius TaxID=79782 RepID=A0A8I6R6B9_CIMLE|nr:LHFPL tetraspan subfamily member 2a protein [Cimex lectularius]XP_024085113.1 LHFPL tetraspan subfamily member 2a protein [Cimex lectularius]
MGHVIVTSISLIWVLLTIVATLSVFSALFSPKWLIGPQRIVSENGVPVATNTPTVGVFNRCTRLNHTKNCAVFAIDGLSTDSNVFPTMWKLSLVFFTLGLTVMAFTAMAALLSCCIQSVYKKSIFTVTGSVQALAGLFYVLGIVMYAAGWGSNRVIRLCGAEAQPFYLGDCSIGWSIYLAVFGILLTLLTASISVYAEKTTSSDKVCRHVEKGDTLVCLL